MSNRRSNILKARKEKLKTELEEVDVLLGPSWNTRDDIARTLISISSAAIVLTLAFSRSITELFGKTFWRFPLFAAYILFMSSIIAAILTLWTSRNARTIMPRFMKDAVKLFSFSEEDEIDTVEQFAGDVINKFSDFHKNNKWSDRFLKVALVCFGVAILIISVVGAKQLVY